MLFAGFEIFNLNFKPVVLHVISLMLEKSGFILQTIKEPYIHRRDKVCLGIGQINL
jgi:hypothetical protein